MSLILISLSTHYPHCHKIKQWPCSLIITTIIICLEKLRLYIEKTIAPSSSSFMISSKAFKKIHLNLLLILVLQAKNNVSKRSLLKTLICLKVNRKSGQTKSMICTNSIMKNTTTSMTMLSPSIFVNIQSFSKFICEIHILKIPQQLSVN